MLFNNKPYRKYFNRANFTIKYLIIPAVIIMTFITIVNVIVRNYIFIYIGSGVILAIYFSSSPINRYLDYLKYGKVNISRTQLITLLKSLSPRQFEVFCAKLFKELGYEVYLMPDGIDGGKDVILNNKIYVECKRYNSNCIGREICQKLLGAVEGDGMKQGILFTNGHIHQNALDFLAKTNRLQLWNMDTIYIKFNSIERHKASLLLDESLKYREASETENNEEPNPNMQPES